MKNKKITNADIYGGSIESRLECSKKISRQIKCRMVDDARFHDNFLKLRQYAEDLNSHMVAMGLGTLCTKCSSNSSGGCCSQFMSGETDSIQLALNILAGIDVGIVCENGKDCFFLGKVGCVFIFKPMFCLNYNCSHIHEASTVRAMRELERLTGRLLGQQYTLEQDILASIRS